MAEGGKACAVSSLFTNNPCTSLEDFSYDEGTPCVALKINKVGGLVEWGGRSKWREEVEGGGGFE